MRCKVSRLWAALLAGSALSVPAEVHRLTQDNVITVLPQLEKIGFEELRPEQIDPPSGGPGLNNPLRYPGLTLHDPTVLDAGFCSAPTCIPDVAQAMEGNITLFLNRGASLTFDVPMPVVVLDVQGMGDNPLTLGVLDGAGGRAEFYDSGVLFGQALVGFSAEPGVRRIDVGDVGGTGGPLVLAAVHFGIPEPAPAHLVFLGACLLAQQRSRRTGRGAQG